MKLLILFLLLLHIQTIFSQNGKSYIYFSANKNSVSTDNTAFKQISPLVGNIRFEKVVNTGVRWGFNSVLVGSVIAVPFLISQNDYGPGVAAVPILIGGVGMVFGIVYGLFSDISPMYNSGNYSYGIKTNFGASLSSESQRYTGFFGFQFRNPNNDVLNPDNYYLFMGSEEADGISENGNHPSLNTIKYGVEFTKVDYGKVINYSYGIGVGYANADFYNSKYNSINDIVLNNTTYDGKRISSLFWDLILGVNLNITRSLHISLEYKYEIFGVYDDRDISEYFSPILKHTVSFSVYSFIY